jgi:hypothetical protein
LPLLAVVVFYRHDVKDSRYPHISAPRAPAAVLDQTQELAWLGDRRLHVDVTDRVNTHERERLWLEKIYSVGGDADGRSSSSLP